MSGAKLALTCDNGVVPARLRIARDLANTYLGGAHVGDGTCLVEDCDGPVYKGARKYGWCSKHYWRWWRHGNTDSLTPMRGLAESERFWAKVDASGVCWEWTASRDPHGYGLFTGAGSTTRRAHRFAYQLLVGPIPEDLTLDHCCRNRCCVNPDHLEPMTSADNTMRGGAPPATNARKTHCPNGHPLSGENLKVFKRSGKRSGTFRDCLTCRRAKDREMKARLRAERASKAIR